MPGFAFEMPGSWYARSAYILDVRRYESNAPPPRRYLLRSSPPRVRYPARAASLNNAGAPAESAARLAGPVEDDFRATRGPQRERRYHHRWIALRSRHNAVQLQS